MSTLMPPPNVTGDCDRRLSRAARQIVTNEMLPYLEQWLSQQQQQQELPPQRQPKNNKRRTIMSKTPQSVAPEYMWQVLEEVIDDSVSSSSCPLTVDRYQTLERQSLQSLPIAASSKVTPRGPSLAKGSYWYHCGICGKIFTSRYYLDLHQHHQHNNHSHHDDHDNTCWAHSVCQSLGGCNAMALELEPYYGRGSSHYRGPDAHIIQREWNKQQQHPSCSPSQITHELIPACRRLMESCFASNNHHLNETLQRAICEPLSCTHLLFKREYTKIQQYFHLDSTWNRHYYATTNNGIVMGMVVLVTLYLLLTYYATLQRQSHGAMRGLSSRKRRNNTSWWWNPLRPKPKRA